MDWIYFLIILSLSVITDTLLIKHTKKPYKGLYKASVLMVFYVLLGVFIYWEYDTIMDKVVHAVMFAAVWTTLKDPLMGLTLHGNPWYLGTGKWDDLWDEWPPSFLMGFKLALCGGLYMQTIHFNLFMFCFFIGVYLTLIIVQWLKDR